MAPNGLEDMKIQFPKLLMPALAAAILMPGLIGAISSITYSLGDEAVELIESLPAIVQKLRRSLEDERAGGPAGPIEKVQAAASGSSQFSLVCLP